MKRHLNKEIVMPVKPFATAPGPRNDATVHDQTCPWRELLQVEEALSISRDS